MVALGLSLAGLFVYCGISKFADKDRAVTVKGLSTREVEADYVVWPLSFGWNGNDLPSLYQQIGNVSEKVKKHLLALGFEESDLRQGPISVDNNSNKWDLDYQYNGLPELKPAMIEEATQNARAVAQKFADDAQCSLGSIRRASQGQFSIENDQYQPWIKHVRVVTTVDYYLD